MKSEIFAISYVVVTIATEKEEGEGGGRERERERSSLGGKCESPRGANCVFSFRCPIQLKSLEYNSLRFNVRRGATGGNTERVAATLQKGTREGRGSGWTQIAYLQRERCNTHAPEAIFSLPTRGYNVFLGTLINSIHFAQRFLITHCTEP